MELVDRRPILRAMLNPQAIALRVSREKTGGALGAGETGVPRSRGVEGKGALHPRDQILRAATDLSADLLVYRHTVTLGENTSCFEVTPRKLSNMLPCPALVVH
jgi:hypothetical protein